MILLGCVSPFAIRLCNKQIRTAGRTAGRIYALSTVGSILGTFAPVLILIPALGTAKTFLAFALLLLAASILALLLHGKTRRALISVAALLVLGALSLAFPQRVVKADEQMIYEQESRYNYIQVLEIDETRYLMLNEGQGVHSVYSPHTLRTFGTWDMFVVAPMFNPPPFRPSQVQRICVIGLAGGTVARQATEAYGPVAIDGIEIDPAIVEVGYEYFHMDLPNLDVSVTDGRFFLEHTDARYDLIVVDAYRLPYIPFQLATTEFFALAKAHLTPQGVITVNVGRTDTDYRMVEAIGAGLLEQLGAVHAIDVPDTFNTVLVATQGETQPSNLQANLEWVDNAFLRDAISRALASLDAPQARDLDYTVPAFTDDRAPVESLTNAIVARYLLMGE
jgi:spermidine synthase